MGLSKRADKRNRGLLKQASFPCDSSKMLLRGPQNIMGLCGVMWGYVGLCGVMCGYVGLGVFGCWALPPPLGLGNPIAIGAGVLAIGDIITTCGAILVAIGG